MSDWYAAVQLGEKYMDRLESIKKRVQEEIDIARRDIQVHDPAGRASILAQVRRLIADDPPGAWGDLSWMDRYDEDGYTVPETP